MKIRLSAEPADLSKHKCLVLGVFSDEKPPRGICGFVDWRLNGYISREIKQGNIDGKFTEKVIIAFPPRLNSELLMLYGMGNVSKFDKKKIHKFAYQLISAVDKLLIDDFSLELPGADRVNIDTADIAETVAQGFFDYLSENADKINKIKSCLLTYPEQLKEATAGIRRFKSKLKESSSD